MASWSVSLDRSPVVEPPNAVVYVTFSSDDGRNDAGVRIPYEDETALFDYLARECARRSALDDRIAAMQAVVDGTTLVAKQQISLPDISDEVAAQAKTNALNIKIGAALDKKKLADAIAIDPTIADAIASESAQSAQLAG